MLGPTQSFTITFNPTGFSSLGLGYYLQTVPNESVQWSYVATGGGSGNLGGAVSHDFTFASETVDLTSIGLTGVTSLALTATTSASGANVYFDDISLTAGVPEPINYALAGFGLIFVGVGAGRYYLGRRRSAPAS